MSLVSAFPFYQILCTDFELQVYSKKDKIFLQSWNPKWEEEMNGKYFKLFFKK